MKTSISKGLSIIIAAIFAFSCLIACSSQKKGDASLQNQTKNEKEPLRIVTTIFPEYDWAMNILGTEADQAEVTMLLDNGVDLHSYQPTADDLLKIANCDVFIYVGGESDEWVEDALNKTTDREITVINLLEILGDNAKEEEIVEGMQEDEHEHEHDEEDSEEEEEHEHEHEEGPEYDEHVWLSLKNTSVLVDHIAQAIASVDPSNADTYKKNAEDYKKKLDILDKKYEDAVSSSNVHTILFGDRFPFRYLADDYGLDYYAAFVGCSAETEASFETVVFLANKVDELSLNSILTIEGTDHRIAETIRENTAAKDQQIQTMDSMQSTTSKDVEQGASYLSIMESNLRVLEEALR